MLYLLHGQDEVLRRRHLDELRAAADGGTGMIASNQTVIEARDATTATIMAAAMAVPFLAPRRLVVVEGVLDRYAGRGGGEGPEHPGDEPAGRPSRRARGTLGPLEDLARVLERDELPPTTDLVLTGSQPGARNPVLERLRPVPGCRELRCDPPKGRDLFDFIRREAGARGLRFRRGPSNRPLDPGDEWRRPGDDDPVALLAARFAGDTLAITHELDKLALYTLGREATVDDVDLVCGGEAPSTVFQLADAAMDGNLDVALRILAYLRLRGESMQGVLALLASGYRRLVTIVDHLEAGATPDEIGRAINLPWEGLRDRAIARARRHGLERIAAAYELIVAADRSQKLGELDEDLAMETLLEALTRVAPAAAASARPGRGASRSRGPAR